MMDMSGQPYQLLHATQFWQPLDSEHPQLAGSRCSRCTTVLFPPREYCPVCGQPDTLEDIPLGRAGTLYAFSVAYAAPAGFDPPYAFGYVQLPEGPRLFARLVGVDCPETALKIGMELELTLAPIRDIGGGRVLWSYAFRPAEHCFQDVTVQKVPHA
jgi:uncharacterized OB-fold protein